MLETKPNKEILKIKNKMFFGFTAYQFFMLLLGLIIGTVLFVILPFHDMIKAVILAVIVSLFTSAAMVQFNNMNLFQLVATVIESRRLSKKPFTVETERRKERLKNGSKYD